ncbi:hypothetical protein ABZ383_34480, partial [Streptomyces sp. NPDC005900]
TATWTAVRAIQLMNEAGTQREAAEGRARAAGMAPGGALATEGTGAHTPAPEASTTDTEQLRLALRDYRETAERLLRL